MYDILKLREEFPILSRTIYNRPLVYLDNAATAQKPRCVIDTISEEYCSVNANVHRGVHYLSQQATELHEAARERVAQFIHAQKSAEIIFTRGTTESLNLLAFSYGERFLKEGDEILISAMEHHSNIVPWQMLRDRKGIVIKVIPMNDRGELEMDAYRQMFTKKTRLVCVAHVSNVLGTINPVKKMAEIAHAHQAHILVDGAQSTPHFEVNVQDIDCDFFAFSGHKTYGPTGIGVLYGKEALLEQLPPYQGGGEMIQRVSWDKTEYAGLPYKFEAGTPDYVGSNALAKALDFMLEVGFDNIVKHEHNLTTYATERLLTIPNLRIYGTAEHKDAVIAFNVEPIHHLDLGTLLDRLGIAIRTGHHCAQPVMNHFKVEGMCRASFAFYNTKEEVDVFVSGLERVIQMF